MLRNYLKVAWRNLVKNKVFSIINIAGLAIGLACFMLIALYVVDELSYDRFHEKSNRIYRVNSDIKFGGSDLHLAVNSDMMGPTLKKDYPQVEEYTRIYASSGSKGIKKDAVFITENNVAHADSTLFNVFTLPSIAGDTRTALNEPNTVVLSETAARKYFGTSEVIGKTIETNDDGGVSYKITAVIKDIPANSHFNLDMIFSMDNVDYGWGNYLSHNFHTYIVLKEGVDPKEFSKNFDTYLEKYVVPQAKHMTSINSMEEFRKAGNRLDYTLIPLTDIHLKSDRFPELSANGDVQYVYIFSAVAVFILIIACINFMNLSTARSSTRAKEVGIRKVLGTDRKRLIRQFLAESTFTAIIALAFALLVAWLTIPYFNEVSAKSLKFDDLLGSKLLPLIIVLPLLVGLLAGSYPAFFLSAFQPITVLKGKLNSGVKRSWLRSTLVVFQFATSIILMVGTIVIYRQINFIQNTKLGFNKDQVLVVDGTYTLGENAKVFKNEIMKLEGVKDGTLSSFLPVSASSRNDNTYSKESVLSSENGFNTQTWRIDENYLSTMGMEIKSGRNFSREFGTDSNAVIINETIAAMLGPGDAVGKTIYSVRDEGTTQPHNIIGVVKNFHFESLRQTVGPLLFTLDESRGMASFKVSTDNIQALVKQVETQWKSMTTSIPFSYRFLDDSFDDMYRSEQRVGKVALAFAILAILIACLGLFGLATYMAEQRTKEIGVRKVLGASVGNIVAMLSKDFLKLVLIATVLAFPIAAWFMNQWLQDFAFRVKLGWWVFAIAGLLAILIAVFTISFQAIRAALANPVKSLRSE